MRTLNKILCMVFFLLLVYFYLPFGFGQEIPADTPEIAPEISTDETSTQSENDVDELRRQVQALQEQLNELQRNLPDVVEDEVEASTQRHEEEEQLLEEQWRIDQRRPPWTLEGGPRRHSLDGRMLVGPGPGYEGAYGVLFDMDAGTNVMVDEGADRVNFYRATITPFIQFDTWGAEMALNVRRFLENEVIQGELREQISDEDFESAYVYYRPINTEEFEVVAYLGQMNEPFVREVVESTVFTNRSIMDKYRLNTSMALRVDLGFGRLEGPNPHVVERVLWVQAASFNLDGDNRSFNDFAMRVILSLASLNNFASFDAIDLSPFQAWGGYAQIRSGESTLGESDAVTDPDLTQRMTVFGLQIDLNRLTGSDLGMIYAEFVHRVRTGDLSDQALVVGYEVRITKEGLERIFGMDLLPHVSGEGRPVEIGIRFQHHRDDPDPAVEDGSVIQASVFYPLTEFNVGIRGNVGYVIQSTDPNRDEEFTISVEIEVLW